MYTDKAEILFSMIVAQRQSAWLDWYGAKLRNRPLFWTFYQADAEMVGDFADLGAGTASESYFCTANLGNTYYYQTCN